jgi:hypothetical protein
MAEVLDRAHARANVLERVSLPIQMVFAPVAALSFWPRTAHPVGAPASGPRAVADLRHVQRYTENGSFVLLAAHSHGALLAATAVFYLPDRAVRRTALLTSACPITRLMQSYARPCIKPALGSLHT